MLRLLVAGVLLFWVVMTTLLLRVTYFPEGSMFEKVPPAMVLRMFLQQPKASSTWMLFQNERKVGPVSISQQRVGRAADTGREEDDYTVQMNGTLEAGSLKQVHGAVVWRISFRVEGLSSVKSATGQVRFAEEGKVLDFEWQQGEDMPKFTLKQDKVVVMDDRLVGPMVAQMLGSKEQRAAAAQAAGVKAEDSLSSLLKLTARQGNMMFSTGKRRGYVVEMTALEQWKVKAFFTEVGELAVMDLPEGFRIMEQIIHGLAPEYPVEEENLE